MAKFAKWILWCAVWSLAGCAETGGGRRADSTAPLLSVYTAYIADVESGVFPQHIDAYFSRDVIDAIQAELGPNEIAATDMSWLIHSSYLRSESIGGSFSKYQDDGTACFTVIGESHEGLPMFVNVEFVLQEGSWLINKVSGHSTDGSVALERPAFASCPELESDG